MFAKYMEQILDELFTSTETALQKREDTLFATSIEEGGEKYTGSMLVHYPGGYLEKVNVDHSNEWIVVNMPGHLITENNRVISGRKQLRELRKMVQGFLRRGFLLAESAGDLPNLLPENIHIHFPDKLKVKIYNSAPVLNRWAIEQFHNKEHLTLKIIRRQLLENVILRD